MATDNRRRSRAGRSRPAGRDTAARADARRDTAARADAGRDTAPRADAAGTGGSGGPVGTDIELEVTNVAHGGVFVARHEGRVVFVSDAIPGERVRARISEARHGSFWRADTVEVLTPSEHRRPHVWSAASVDRDPADRAGGAEFGHIELGYQRSLKASVISDALDRMAKLELAPIVEAAPGDEVPGDEVSAAAAAGEAHRDAATADQAPGLGWRTRVRLQVAEDGTVGPYAARSHRVIAVDDLPLATAAVAAAAPLRSSFPGARSVDVIGPSTGGEIVFPNEPARASASRPHIIRERVGEREFELDARGFWQVHHQAAGVLTRAVQDAVDDASFDPAAANLDLYGGVGLLAAAVGDRFGRTTKITSVESAANATDFAARNLVDWVGAAAVTDRAERYVARAAAQASGVERGRQRAATVVLDPPRSGAGKAVVGSLLALEPAQIVYVACDPVAFARDVALFAAGGYEVRALRAFDLFPHTHHVEVVARLTR
jgi:tRNA/tmRNA/rRNA uracil-C5-methylase (TrmA/RlmC/RlmD family)